MSQNKDYGELFCQAIDEIVKKRLEGISYDQTILCTIIDDSLHDKGSYVVTNNGKTKFEAFSSDTTYRNNNNVYVQIPGGDWNQQKIIIAKKTDKTEEPYVYKKPFASLVDITGNLINSNIDVNETGLIANAYDPDIVNDTTKDQYDDEYQAITLWTYNANQNNKALRKEEGPAHSAYTRLGIQASFQSWLNPFYTIPADASDEQREMASNPRYVTSGEYGLRMRVTTIDETTSKDKDGQEAHYDLYLNCADMNGNPYDFQSFYTQEKVFDISAVGKIVAIELQFYQKAGSFKDRDDQLIPYQDFLGHYIKPNLYVKDVYISLGYDVSEFDKEMIQIYTLDSTTYSRTASPLTKNHKKVQLRWIHKQEDGSFKSITLSDTDLDYEVRWYRYQLGHSSADEYSGVYWKNLSKQEVIQGTSAYNILDEDWEIYNKTCTVGYRRDPGFFSTWMIPDTTLQEEQIKAVLIYKNQPYRSNILVCRNEDEVVSKPTVDAVQALSVSCDDDTFGNYRIYNQGNSLIDSAQANIQRKWIPYFKSSTGGTDSSPVELIEAESIEWIIPTNKTMIIIDNFPNPGKEEGKDKVVSAEKDGKVFQRYWYDSNDDQRLHIIRYGSGTKGNDISDYNFQSYRIKSYYSQTYSDNTIQCKIVKDKITYTATKELTFGVAGTTGTDCTFILDFDNGITAVTNNATDAVTVTARLYDYENNEIELKNYPITWGWKVNDGLLKDEVIGSETNFRREIKRNTENEWNGPSYNILKASMTWGNTTLETYLPIPIRASNTQAYISGTTQIIYNSAGELLDYFKNPYILYGSDTKEIPVAEWTCINGYKSTDEKVTTDESAYTPKIKKDNKTGEQYLTPLSFYVAGACEKVCVVGKDSNSAILWSQPLLIMQNRYPSAMVNSWDGNLNIGGPDGQSIFAPRFVAGKKETDNTFSGVMLGNWSDTVSDNSLTQGDTGLYGYDKGEQSYAFKQDGSAFIGKSGAARIVFNDQEPGAIYSNAWTEGTKGMKINLADGTIDAHTFTLTAGTLTDDESAVAAGIDKTILIDTTADKATGFPLQIGSNFKVDWNGKLTAQSGSFTGDIESGSSIIGSTIKGGTIIVPSTATSKTDAVFYVGPAGDMKAYNADIEGDINATSLTCEYGTIGGWTINATSLQGGSTILNSDGSISNGTAFTVSSTGALTASGATITGTINANQGYIGGWTIEESSGTATNTRGWNAIYASDGYYYTFLDPSRDNVIAVGIPSSDFKVNHNSAKFRVTSAGKMYATDADIKGSIEATTLTCDSGTIGGWTISATGLSASGVSISPSGGITGGISIDSAKITNATISSGTIGGITINSGSLAGTGWSLTSSGATFTSLTVGGYEFKKKTIYYGYYSPYGNTYTSMSAARYIYSISGIANTETGAITFTVGTRGFKYISRSADVVGANVVEEDD